MLYSDRSTPLPIGYEHDAWKQYFDDEIASMEGTPVNTCQEMHPQMHAQEKQIILTILEDALHAGYEVSVFDGEEIVLTNGTKMEEIFESMFSTDMDTLFFAKGGHEATDWVWLIYGNREAVISDYADSPAMEALLKRADALAETYS